MLIPVTQVNSPSVVGYGTALPVSPGDTNEYILVDSTTNPTYQWRFRYNVNNSTSYKWEFIGGTPYVQEIVTEETTTSATYVDLTTVGPSFTVPRAGVYQVEHAAAAGSAGGSAVPVISVKIGSAATADADGYSGQAYPTPGFYFSKRKQLTCAASDLLLVQYKTPTGGGTLFARQRQLIVTPVRVS
jgi:hypothetical protein